MSTTTKPGAGEARLLVREGEGTILGLLLDCAGEQPVVYTADLRAGGLRRDGQHVDDPPELAEALAAIDADPTGEAWIDRHLAALMADGECARALHRLGW